MERKRRTAALALLLTAVLLLCMVPALAEGDTEPDGEIPEPLEVSEPADGGESQEAAGDGEQDPKPPEETNPTEVQPPEETPPSDDSETIFQERESKGGGVWQEGYDGTEPWITTVDDDLVYTGETDFRNLKFSDLRERVLEGSLSALMLEESIASIDSIDFTRMYQDLADQMSSLEQAQSIYAQIPIANEFEGAMQGYVISNLQSSYSALSSNVADLATGQIQKDYAAAKRQLQNARDQMVIGAESLYIAILELEQTQATLERNLTALDRTVKEMEVRYRLGQVSALTAEQVKSGKASLESSLSTVEMNLRRCKLQLQAMIGVSMNGSLVLGPLPELSDGLLASMDQKEDLAEAKNLSYDLFAAKKKLNEASEAYDDAQESYTRNSYNLRSARHTYESALYEYKASVQNFEMGFRNAYDSVKDYQQILNASQTTLAFQEKSYASAELKYQQGTLSANALADAGDDLAEAKDAVATARRNLFTAYRTYYWAVSYGVMNSSTN